MPVDVACLVPSAPLLLPRLTGDRVPEAAPVREAVAAAVSALVGLGRVVVVAPHAPGTLAGFGAPDPTRAVGTGAHPTDPGTGVAPAGGPSWSHALAAELLDAAGAPRARRWLTWQDLAALPDATAPAGTGLLLLADGSRTRGPRAPGGEDPRGDVVDAELVAALAGARPPVVPDAGAVGATAAPAVTLLASLADGHPGRIEVLHTAAPLGVCYLVAVCRPRSP